MARFSILCIAALFAAGAPITARADFIANTFGPGNSFTNEGFGIELFNGPLQQEVLGFGVRFVPQRTSYLLDQVSLPLSTLGGNKVTLTVYNDASGQPGQSLETFQINGIGGNPQIFTVNSVARPVLTQNQVYYLIASIPSADQDVAWSDSPTGAFDVLLHGPYRDGRWDVLPNPQVAFSVSGTPVPEPASGFICGALVVGCLLVLAAKGRALHVA